MKINGKLSFDASSSSVVENLRLERVADGAALAYTANDIGRLVYSTAGNVIYYADNGAQDWIPLATGGNAFPQAEGDAIEAALGAGFNTTTNLFNAGAFSAPISSAASFTDAINQLAAYADANNTLAELDDVALAAMSNNQFLVYNGGTSKWVNHTLVLADVTDVTALAAEVNELAGAGAVQADFTKLHAVTADAAELNILDGATLTVTELNYVDGVTSPIQAQLDDKQTLDGTLTALAALDGTAGVLVQTGADAFARRTLQAPAAGITISNPAGTAGDPTFALANDLAGLEGLTTTGYAVRTGDGTWTNRVINGVAGRTVVTNGDGITSNTDVDLATLADGGAGTFLKITRDAYGRVSGTEAVTTADITTLVDTTYVNVAGDTMTGNLIMGTNYVTMNSAPTADNHAANKAYVDAVAAGLSWKNAVRAASTGNLTLATTSIVDGVTLTTGDRVLVKNQTATAENGIYTFNGTGLARSTDMDAASEFAGATVFVSEGTTNADSGWTQTAEVVTLGTSAVSWAQFSGSTTYTWGTGLSSTGNTIFVNLGAGITELPSDEIGLDLVSNLALQLTGASGGDKLTFVLEAGGGLEQSSAGLKISAAGVTNAMLLNNSITFNSDAGNAVQALGSTLLIAGTSTQGINTSVSGSTLTITAANASDSQKGVATFNAADFLVTSGDVTIKAGGVDNAQLANSKITLTGTDAVSDDVSLGETVTFASASTGLVSVAVSGNTATVGVRLADATNTGVASFDAAHFSVTAGAVSLAATLDDLTNVSGADTAATGDLLTKTAGDWQTVSRDALVGSTSIDAHNDVTLTSPANGDILVYAAGQFVNKKAYYLHTQSSAGTSWTVSHGLGQQYCNVTVVDDTDNVIIPQSIVFTSASALTVTFNTAVSGKVVVMGIA